ncbi:MAG: NUDIX domain-containing protein [Planctomycetes bacterium]|nr:NUDIX domain-containing protein [Planctomycetota bacterium]
MSKAKILVIARKHIPESLLKHGFNPASEYMVKYMIENPQLLFMERDLAENDPNYKQLIPYVVFKSPKGFFNYQRGKASSETRLRMLRSLGVGGHIEQEDGETDENSYLKGLWRELKEEVGIAPSKNIKLLGFINDDTNEVGQVHFGIVHLYQIETSDLESQEHNLTDCRFSNMTELKESEESYETWSRILIPYLES